MSRFSKRVMAAGCALCLLMGIVAAQAAPAAQSARGTVWTGGFIVVDDIPVYFMEEQGKQVSAIIYNNSVYIPAQSAGEWLGGTAVWDAASQTVTLTRGESPFYYNINEGLPELPTSEQYAKDQQFQQDMQDGIELTLYPGAAVLLDGERVTFRDALGETLCPILFRGVVYLPVRGVGELCGKQVLWYKTLPYLQDAAARPEHLEDLGNATPGTDAEPPVPYVLLYDPLTGEETQAVRTYLEQAEALWDEMLQGAITYRDTKQSLTEAQTRMALEKIQAAAEEVAALELPHPVLGQLVHQNIGRWGEQIGQWVGCEAAEVGGKTELLSAASFERLMVNDLYEMRYFLDMGWDLLGFVGNDPTE